MQRTLTIDDNLLLEAERIAASRGVAVDVVVADALRDAIDRNVGIRFEGNVPVFDIPIDAKPFGLEDIRRADEEY